MALPFENNNCFHCCLSLSFMLHFYLNFVGSKLQSIQYRVFSWPPDWGSQKTTTIIIAAPPPSRGQPHAAPRTFAAARRRRPHTNTHPGCQDSTRHAMKPALSLARHRGQHLTASAAATTPPGPSHRGVTFPPEQLDTAIQNAGRSSTPQPKTPLPGRDPPSVEPAFPLSKTRGRYGCCNTLPIVSGQPTSPLPLSGYQTEHITISRAPTALLGTSSNASLRNPAQRHRVQRL